MQIGGALLVGWLLAAQGRPKGWLLPYFLPYSVCAGIASLRDNKEMACPQPDNMLTGDKLRVFVCVCVYLHACVGSVCVLSRQGTWADKETAMPK